MSNITAALGISQLQKIDKIIELRRANAGYLISALAKINAIGLPIAPHDYLHIYQMFTIRAPRIRDSLQEHLKSKNIMSKVYYEPVHLTHFYSKVLKYSCQLPTTERISKEVLTLPMYPTLSTEEMDYVVGKITEFCDANLTC
jgi:perosamine synthetase